MLYDDDDDDDDPAYFCEKLNLYIFVLFHSILMLKIFKQHKSFKLSFCTCFDKLK